MVLEDLLIMFLDLLRKATLDRTQKKEGRDGEADAHEG